MTQKATTGDAPPQRATAADLRPAKVATFGPAPPRMQQRMPTRRAREDHAEGATYSDGNHGEGEKDERCQRPASWRSSCFS
eukprot:gene4682-183_t